MSNTRNRGFASMNSEKQREIARKGGRAAHEKGTSDEARAAGRKGGERVSANREHMSRIGRLGGKRSAGRRSTSSNGQPGSDQGGSSSDGGFEKGSGDGASANAAEPQMQMSGQPGQSAM